METWFTFERGQEYGGWAWRGSVREVRWEIFVEVFLVERCVCVEEARGRGDPGCGVVRVCHVQVLGEV